MQRVYLDSNVFISIVKSEMGKPFRLMYQHAQDFLAGCSGRYQLVLSDLAVQEIALHGHASKEEVVAFLEAFKIEVVWVFREDADRRRAREIEALGVHYPDSLHVALALKARAQILVTWNVKDFVGAGHLILVKAPDELI